MAQPQQPQQQAPPRAFSPHQNSPSPANSQAGYPLPPKPRPQTNGPNSQPNSPYPGSPYVASPVGAGIGTPPASNSTASPTIYAQQQVNTPGGYQTPHANGASTPVLSLPTPQGVATPPPQQQYQQQQYQQQQQQYQQQQYQQQQYQHQQYTNATMTPMMQPGTPMQQQQPQGIMGPPQRPAERATKDYEYDPTDMLSGTGIDLNAEEKYMADLFSTSFDASSEARTGFAQQHAGNKGSFYGAGPANASAQSVGDQEQKAFEAESAERAWNDSAMKLGAHRSQELRDPFLFTAQLFRRADKIARENGIGLNLDYKTTPPMGKMKLPHEFPAPKVTVSTKVGPDSTMVTTTGSFVPHDSYLVDQLALLSISSKYRLRELLEDASVIADTRQKTSHGEVPQEWTKAAAPLNKEPLADTMDVDAPIPDSAVSPGTNPLKRSATDAALPNETPQEKLPKIASYMTATMREMAKRERDWEEARLRRRQKRRDGTADQPSGGSRSNSVAPGTPGSVAPDPDKMTKKEMKKNQAAKAAEAHSHANQNMTSSMFAGLGGKGGLFGKKKGGKSYSWMTGGGGSGAATPSKGSGGGKSGGGPGASQSPAAMALTTEGRNRLGGWREDKEKGQRIQLRDWVSVLERDGRSHKALQSAYMRLDLSDPR